MCERYNIDNKFNKPIMSKFRIKSKVVEEESTVINPYNENNIALTEEIVANILKRGGLDFSINNFNLYVKAFTHKSYSIEKNMEQINKNSNLTMMSKPRGAIDLKKFSNERLEFLGDSILGAVVTSYLFRRYFDQNEGFMTKLKTRLVNTSALANFARYLGLGKYILMSKQVEIKNKGRRSERILEDTFEALVGAMFLDFNKNKQLGEFRFRPFSGAGPGYQVCEKFILYIIENEVDMEKLILNDTNYKDQLIRYYHHNFQLAPKYKELKIDGPSHKRQFTIAVLDKNGVVFTTATEKTKKKAEQLASKNALIKYGQFDL